MWAKISRMKYKVSFLVASCLDMFPMGNRMTVVFIVGHGSTLKHKSFSQIKATRLGWAVPSSNSCITEVIFLQVYSRQVSPPPCMVLLWYCLPMRSSWDTLLFIYGDATLQHFNLFSLGLGRSQRPILGPKMYTKVAFNTTHHTKLFDQFQTK